MANVNKGKGGKGNEDNKLFRLLALKYRCKFPIKGEKWEIGDKVRVFLQNVICQEAIKRLLPSKGKNGDGKDKIQKDNRSESSYK